MYKFRAVCQDIPHYCSSLSPSPNHFKQAPAGILQDPIDALLDSCSLQEMNLLTLDTIAVVFAFY